jgi:hypothetical protein
MALTWILQYLVINVPLIFEVIMLVFSEKLRLPTVLYIIFGMLTPNPHGFRLKEPLFKTKISHGCLPNFFF